MARYSPGPRRDPLLIHYDRHSDLRTLHEAKLAAWALAAGARLPNSGASRRLRRGMLPDLPPPEAPPPRTARPSPAVRLWRELKGLFGKASAAPAGAAAPAFVADDSNVTYIGRTDTAETAAAEAAGDVQPVRRRAA